MQCLHYKLAWIDNGKLLIINCQLSIVNLLSSPKAKILLLLCVCGWTPIFNFLYMGTNYTNYQFIYYHNVNVMFHGSLLATVRRTSFLVQRYLGCDRVNRKGTTKLIDYQRGETCLLATNEQCWRRTKAKYLSKKTCLTRQRQKYMKCLRNFYIINGSQ